MEDAKRKLIMLLQKAHAGERAAALAYGGHWRSLRDAAEIAVVKKIERDEWIHRARIAEMLFELGAKPLFFREILFAVIGLSVGISCHFIGKFCAAFFAGVLESVNVCEYRQACSYADALGLKDLAVDFLEMEQTEAEHEIVLHEMICEHPLLPLFASFFGWGKTNEFVLRRQNVRF